MLLSSEDRRTSAPDSDAEQQQHYNSAYDGEPLASGRNRRNTSTKAMVGMAGANASGAIAGGSGMARTSHDAAFRHADTEK